MEERIRKAVETALERAGADNVGFDIERPADPGHGDYATNVALKAFGPLVKSQKDGGVFTVGRELSFVERYKNPKAFAESLISVIQEELKDYVESVTVAGPGFINITLSTSVIRGMVDEALSQGSEWGKGVERAGKSVMVEYSNPNPFKEMHIGHLMSNVIGEAVSRVIENSGAHVLRDTFGGDVGPHVAKALWALKKKGVTDIASVQEIGDAYISGSRSYEESEEAKAEIDALNTKIYDIVGRQEEGVLPEEEELLRLWRKGRQVSMQEFERIFALLGTKFDYIFYDSDTTRPGTEAVMRALEEGVFEKSDGAIIYRGEKKGLHTLVFITSRGTPLYPTKDVGLAFLKEERRSTDEVIILTGLEQEGHFKVTLAALEDIAPLVAKKMRHVPHGLLSLTTGKMSSRKGNIITGAGLLRDMTEEALKKNEDPFIAEQVAVAAVKYMILRQATGANVVFDPAKSLSLEGDSGPYLQYALVRAKKILSYQQGTNEGEVPNAPYAIERLITRFPEVAARAARELAPHHIAQYLTHLASAWNSFYASEQVLGSKEEAYKLRVASAFALTMEHGLSLLGIPAPERM